jgi:hypothetical protein
MGSPMPAYPIRRPLLVAALALAAVLAWAGTARSATTLGETFDPTFGAASQTTLGTDAPPGITYTVPSPGVITSWSFQADSPAPDLTFKLARPEGGGSYLIVDQAGPESPIPSTFNTFLARIPAHAGDLIGYFQTNGNTLDSLGGYARASLGLNPQPGDSFAPGEFTGQRLDLSAILEPDADGDGFGDETQDDCPTGGSTQAECVPPDTTITSGPKEKTKKRRATFEFNSSEPGSSFECAVDGQARKAACTSPFTVKVKRGKHTLEVRATDQLGNADPTPATDSWKVKKRKK